MGANKIFEEFAQENGFQYDSEVGLIHGRANGHAFCATRQSASTNHFYLTLSAKRGESADAEESAEALQKLCKESKALHNPQMSGSSIRVEVLGGATLKSSTEKLRTGLNEIALFLTTNGFTDCCEQCGTTMGVIPSVINGSGHLLCAGCYKEVTVSLEDNKKVIKSRKGNLLTGLVGALLGSLIGVAAIILISQLGYVAAISGVIMGVCTLKGYELLGGKATVLGLSLCVVLMAVMVLFGNNLDWAILVTQAFEDVTVFEAFRDIFYLVQEEVIEVGDYALNLFQLYAFTALGAIPAVLSFFRTKSGSYKAKQMA